MADPAIGASTCLARSRHTYTPNTSLMPCTGYLIAGINAFAKLAAFGGAAADVVAGGETVSVATTQRVRTLLIDLAQVSTVTLKADSAFTTERTHVDDAITIIVETVAYLDRLWSAGSARISLSLVYSTITVVIVAITGLARAVGCALAE